MINLLLFPKDLYQTLISSSISSKRNKKIAYLFALIGRNKRKRMILFSINSIMKGMKVICMINKLLNGDLAIF